MKKRGNGEGSVFQKRDGTWVAQVNVGWVDGRCKRRYASANTRAEASQKLRKILSEREAGVISLSGNPTMAAWMETYLRDVAAKRVRVSTLRRYEMDIRNHLLPQLGKRRLRDVRPNDLADLYNRKLSEGLSATSVRHLHAVIRRALNVAMRWQLVSVNVATLVEPPSVTSREVVPLTASQAKDLLTAAKGTTNEARWAVGLALGLRQGEVLGLQWADIDFDGGVLRVQRALQRQSGSGLVFVAPKTARSRRTLPLPAPLLSLLREHRAAQARARLRAGNLWRDSGCVFTNEIGGPIEPKADWAAFKALLRTAGLPDVRLHDLRHTAASLLLIQGVPARVVMEVLGHSQISLTMNTYSHVAPELQRDALSRMGHALWG